MKYQKKKYNMNNIKKAIYEYKNTDISGDEVSKKYNITRATLLYHANKFSDNINSQSEIISEPIKIRKSINESSFSTPRETKEYLSSKDRKLRALAEQVQTESNRQSDKPEYNIKSSKNDDNFIKNNKGETVLKNYKDYITPLNTVKSIFDENI